MAGDDLDLDRVMVLYELLADGVDETERRVYYVHPGDPVSKHRVRFGRGRTYSARGQTDAETTLGMALRVVSGLEPFRGNVAVACVFYRQRRQPVDVDNLLKHVLDAGTGALWSDDRQVTGIVGVLEHDPARPRTVIVAGRHRSTMARDEIIAGVCEFCGAPFEHPGWRAQRQRFCSPGCTAKSRGQDLSAPIPCRQCRASFTRVNSYQVLCSATCRVEWLRGRNRAAGNRSVCRDCGTLVPNHRAVRCRACWIKARNAGIA